MALPTHQGHTFKIEPLTPDEVRALVNAASTRSTSGIRDRAMMGMLYGGGLRISEALALRPRDVDTTRGVVRVHRGKGDRARVVGIDVRASSLLDHWIERRASLGLSGREPLFCTYGAGHAGNALSPIAVRRSLARLAIRAKIDKRVNPHGLRHSLAMDLAQQGTPVNVIQRQLGHSNLAVTDAYLRRVMPADVVAAMRDRQW